MAYSRTTWANGDLITAEKLNNLESGILGNESEIAETNGELTNLRDDLNLIGNRHNIVDSAVLLYSNNGKIVNNNDGTYTVKSGDYGDSIFGSQMTLEPGYYLLYGVPSGVNGYPFLSTTQNSSGAFVGNYDQPNGKVIYISETKQCYLGYRQSSSPSTAFKIAPFIEKDSGNDIANLKVKTDKIANDENILLNTSFTRSDELSDRTNLTGYYLNDVGRLIGGQGNNLKVSYFPVNAGDVVCISGKDVKLYSAYTLAVFSDSVLSSGETGDEILLVGSTTATDYEKYYICPKNGYIYIHYVDLSGYSSVDAYSTIKLNTLIENIENNIFEYIADTEIESTAYNKKYINSDYTINSIDNAVFYVDQFAVEANKAYILTSNSLKLQAALPIAGFGTGSITDTQTLQPIIGNDTATEFTAYNVTFIAPSNGYIYTAYADNGSTRMRVYEAESVIKGLYELTNSSLLPLKIQVFGDSLSDETWRTDGTTWVTILYQFLTQRTLDITNNAVGGSGIGHGKSTTARYPDLEYNYVYDLVTNQDIFKTDSDIIIMLVGTNDWAAGRTLGQWGDDTATSFYGYARLITQYITTNTGALFIICTPPGRWDSVDETRTTNANGEPLNSNGKTLREFCDALVETANYFEVPVLDLHKILGWNKYNVRRFCSDGLHPTPNGARWLSAIISNIVKFHIGA